MAGVCVCWDIRPCSFASPPWVSGLGTPTAILPRWLQLGRCGGAGRGRAGRGPAPGGRGGRSPLPQPAQGWKRPSAGLVHDGVTAAGRGEGLGQYEAALALAKAWDPWPARPGFQSQPQDAFKFSASVSAYGVKNVST